MRTAFESAGDIRSVDLLAALVALWRQQASGSLRFSRPGATAGFDILEGELVLSLSSQPQYETAAILSRAGKLDSAALEKLKRPAGGDASIAALQAGLITEREWRWGQKIRAIEILSDLLGWLEGEYSFDPQARPAAGDWTLTVPRLVLELFLRSRDRTLVEHYLGPSDLPLLRAKTFDEEFETFGLTSDAGAVVALIDGRASAEEIAERAPAEEFAVLKLLAALTTLGLVHPAEAAPEPATGTPSPMRPESREREPVAAAQREPAAEPESEPESGPEPEGVVAPVPAAEVEPEMQEEAPAAPVEQPPEEIEAAPPPARLEEEKIPSAEVAGLRADMSEPERGPEIEPTIPPPTLPEDLAPEGLEPAVATEVRRGTFEHEFPPADDPPPPGEEKSRMGAVLASLLALLIVGVTVLLIARSRRTASEPAAVVAERPTAQENPLFPPPETAVHLPAKRTQPALPSPAATHPVAVPPTAAPTIPARPTPPPTQPPPTRPPTQAPTHAPTRAAPTPVPTRRQPTPAATGAQPTRPPTRIPTNPEPTAPVQPTAAPTMVAAAREGTRSEWIARAERDRKSLSKRRDVRYTVQLELACEVPTLEKAWAWDKPPGTMWLLTTSYRGKTCFRVLWGRFAGLPEAREAKTRVPDFFLGSGNRPIVVSAR